MTLVGPKPRRWILRATAYLGMSGGLYAVIIFTRIFEKYLDTQPPSSSPTYGGRVLLGMEYILFTATMIGALIWGFPWIRTSLRGLLGVGASNGSSSGDLVVNPQQSTAELGALIVLIVLAAGILVGWGLAQLLVIAGSPQGWLAFGTILLVLVTGYYAWQTRRTVSALEKATEAQFLPHLKMTLFTPGPASIFLKLVNVGTGSAKHVEVRYSVKELKGSEKLWKTPLLSPGEFQEFWLPTGPEEKHSEMTIFEKTQSTLETDASFDDIMGKHHTQSESIDVTSWVKGQANAIWGRDPLSLIHEDLKKLRESVAGIEKTLKESDSK